MTREVPQPVMRSIGRYGESGPWHVNLGPHSPFVADPDPSKWPKPTIADRYTATARTRGDRPGPLASVTITERESGSTFGWTARGNRVTMRLGGAASAAAVARLWKDGRDIIGIARTQLGRPSEQAERIAAIVEAAISLGPAATREKVAADLGRVDEWGAIQSDFKRDVRAAGGWPEVLRLAERREF